VLDDGTGVRKPTGNERVGDGVKVGTGEISFTVTVAGTWVTAGALSEVSEGVAESEELQAEIKVVKTKIIANILFNMFLHVVIYKYQNAEIKPACTAD
jgi:hypothetical protein